MSINYHAPLFFTFMGKLLFRQYLIYPKQPFPEGFTVLITNIKGEGKGGDEPVITLIPGSDGAYTVQYDPAGVCITE